MLRAWQQICFYCGKETAMDAAVRTAVCTEYERLLKESHQALAEFNEHLAGVLTFDVGGKKWDDELRKRQAKYAKAYRNLQNHAHNCELCALVSGINVLAAA
jgi:intergrase/recombinase